MKGGNSIFTYPKIKWKIRWPHDEIIETEKSRLTNKVTGIVVTCNSDVAEYIIGNLANFLITMGLTILPSVALTVLWSGF